MGDHSAIEFVLAGLLARSFTLVGLSVLWAAASKRHWFLRTAVFFAALAPLLSVPAYEPLIAFCVQGAVVAIGVDAYRRWRKRCSKVVAESSGDEARQGSFRFSLSTLLLLTVIVAAMTPVALKLPTLNAQAWTSVVFAGVVCGVVTLVAGLMLVTSRKWVVWPLGLLLCAVAGLALGHWEWLAYAISNGEGWPPVDPNSTSIPAFMSAAAKAGVPRTWLLAIPAICVLIVPILLLWTMFEGKTRIVARVVATAIVALVSAMPLSILWQLAHPLPLPKIQLPHPNGYDDLVAAGNAFNMSPILNTTVEPKSTAQLAAEVAKFGSTFERVRVALSRPTVAPVWPDDPKKPSSVLAMPDIQAFRSVARALDREAQLAREEGRFSDAARISIENMRVGQASTRGGMVISYLVALAVEGIGQESLYPAIGNLDAAACRETVASLEQADREREPLDAVFHNDRIYSENAIGWNGHLFELLQDAAYGSGNMSGSVIHAERRVKTINRLLSTQIALRLYRLEHGSLPDRLEKLIPQYMSALPIDPFDVDHGPMRYSLTSDGFLLYSVGYDRDDDGGRPSPRESGWLDDGDMRLDSFYAPYEDEANAVGKTEAAADESEPVEPGNVEP